jgi:DNA mismatch repair protein MutS
VAQLAGLPKSVIVRAQEVLAELESHASKKRKAPRRKAQAQQLPLFPRDSLLAEEIAKLDVDSMSPMEAITKLYELKRMVQER